MDDSNRHGHSTMVGPSVAPTLEIVRGNEQGKTVRLKLTTRIGRERDNDLTLTDPRVSRYHALIELVEDRWAVRDLGSVNGTYVNGQLISGAHPLKPDDRITVGDTAMVFQPSRVRVGVSTPSPAPRPQPPVPARSFQRTSPRWGLAGIAGGLALLLILVIVAIFALSMFGRRAGHPSEATVVASDESPDDFILIYEDDFSDPSSGWDDAFDRYTTKQYGNNKYYIEVTTSNLVAWGLANRDVTDFRLEVDAAQEVGPNNNGYGILFRFQDRNNFYRFDISGDGFFLLSKFYEGEWVTLIPWTASSAVNVGQASNRLVVESVGSQIRVYANDALLAEVEDDTFSHGNFGFFASTFSEPNLTISYDDIKLWTPKGRELAIIPTATPTRFAPTPTGEIEVALQITPSPTEVSEETPTPKPTLLKTSTAEPEATATPSPVPTVTPTPEPLPEYASRDLPPARGAVPLSGRIVFPIFDAAAGTYNIFSAKPDGSDRILVAAEASQPTLSPTGEHIAFRSWKADNRGLMERAIEGGDVWKFNAFFESARPTFSPDGQIIIFHSRQGGETPAIYRTAGADHEVLRREAAPIQGESPAWTPDGRFVYKGCWQGGCGLILSNFDGSFPLQITFDPSDTNPAVSPDGQTVAFMSPRSGNWDVYTVGVDGTGLAQLTTDPANDGLPTWSPDGENILFVSERDGAWAAWVMNPDGGNQRPLFDLGGSIDGQVQVDVKNARGWLEESIAWGVDSSQ
jgi:hypothetical protein